MATFQYTVVADLDGPIIAPSSPLSNDVDVGAGASINFSVSDVSGVQITAIIIRINGQLVFSSGVAQNGATVTTTPITGGFDFSVITANPLPTGGPQAVFISAQDTIGNLSELVYTFFTGVKPRIISVSNTSPGTLVVRFNEPMKLDDVFRRVQNFSIQPVGSAPAVTVLEVMTNSLQPDAATLIFSGGGSPYTLTVTGVTDVAGNAIDPQFNSTQFNIDFPGGELDPRIHIFDTVFGPLGLIQRTINRRTVDGLVVNRSLDLGVNIQLANRLKSIGSSVPLRQKKDGGRRT